MDADKLQILLESVGFEKMTFDVDLLLRTFDKLNTISTRKLSKNIEENSKSLGTSQKSLKSFITEFDTWNKKQKELTGKSGSRKIRYELDLVKDYEEVIKYGKVIKETIEQQLKNIKVGDLESARGTAGIQKQIQGVPAEERAKFAKTTLVLLKQQMGVLLKEEKSEERKFKILQNYNKLLDNSFNLKTRLVKTDIAKGDVAIKGVSKEGIRGVDDLRKAHQKLAKAQIESRREAAAFEKSQKKVKESAQQLDASIGLAINKLIRYRVSFYAMRAAIEAVKNSVVGFAELQYQLADLQKVIDRSKDSIIEYKNAAITMAKTFGDAISDIVGVMKTWAQTGLEQEEVLKATFATLIGVNALGGTTKQVVESLTAAIFTYGVAVDDITRVISKWLVVQKEFPVNAQDLADSLKVVGAAAQVVGVNLNDLAGYVAAIGSATRKSGKAVGQSLKTMFARLPRKQVIAAFEGINIAVLKTANELRDLDNILDDLSNIWDDLSTVQKANIATTFGGIRRYSDFIALMDNYEIKVAAVAQAQKATTESFDASNLSLNTLKKNWEKSKASVEEFSLAIGKGLAGPLGNFVDAISSIMNLMNKFPKVIKLAIAPFITFIASLAGIGVVLVGISFAFTKIHLAIKNYIMNIRGAQLATAGFEASAKSATVATVGFGGALRTFGSAMSKANAWIFAATLALSAAMAIWTALSDSATDASESVEDYNASLEGTILATREQIKGIKTQNKLLDEMPRKLRKLTKDMKNFGETSPKGIKTFERLQSILKGLPSDYTALNLAQVEYTASLYKSDEALDNVIENIRAYILENKDLIKSLEELEGKQTYLLEDQLKREILGLKKRETAIEDFIKTIKMFVPTPLILEVIPLMNFATVKNEFWSSTNLQKLADDANFKEIVESVAANPEAVTFNVFQKELVEQFKKVIDNFVLTRNEQIKKGALNEEDMEKLLIKPESIETIFKNLTGRMKVLTRSFNKQGGENFKIPKIDTPERKEFFDAVIDELGIFQDDIARVFDVNRGNFASVSASLKKNLTDLQTDLVNLRKTGEDTDSSLTIGPRPAASFTQLSKKIQDVIKDNKLIGREFELLRKAANFDTILNFDEFSSKKAFKFVKDLGDAFAQARKDLGESQTLLDELRDIKILITTDTGELRNDVTDLSVLLADFSEESKKFLDEPNNLLATLEKHFKDTNLTVNKFIALLADTNLQNIFKKAVSDAEQLRNIYQEIALEQIRLQNTGGVLDVATIGGQIKILQKIKNTQEEVYILEKKKIELTKKLAEETNRLTQNPIAKLKEQTKIIKKYFNDTKRLMEKMLTIRLDKIYEKAAGNAEILRDALSGAFAQIPSSILEGAEKRKEVSEDLRKAEFELQEVKKEGDEQSIRDAQYRIDLIKYELDQYKKGWHTIGKVVGSIFDSISGKYWQKLADHVADSFANISIGGKTLGTSVGDAIFVATTKFTENWRNIASVILDKHTTDMDRLLKNNIASLQAIEQQKESISTSHLPTSYGTSPTGGLFPIFAEEEEPLGEAMNSTVSAIRDADTHICAAVLSGTVQSEKDVKGVEGQTKISWQKTDELKQALIAGTTMVASSLAIALTGSGSREANVGAQFGSMVGSAAGKKYAGEILGSTLGWLGGPLGSLAGGILGGAIGGLFAKKDKPEETLKPIQQAVDTNTEATLQNTLALKELDKAIFNAPTKFTMPVASGSFGSSVQINITGNSNKDIISQTVNALNEIFDENSNTYGTRGYASI